MSLHNINIEYKIKNVDNRREECEAALSRVSYNGEYKYVFFPVKREKLDKVINKWQESYCELRCELENWKYCDEGTRFMCRETVSPLFRGKNVACVFLKIYDSGEPNILYCISIFGDISIKVRVAKIVNRMFGWAGFADETEKKCIKMVKACPKIMAALIMSKDSGLKIEWEDY